MGNHGVFQWEGVRKILLLDLGFGWVIWGRFKKAEIWSRPDAVRKWG